jgi:predicted GNAT family N-acyltransferase
VKNCYWIQPAGNTRVAIADLTNIGEMVPHTMTITRINVPEELRGQGLGSQLLKMIIADADEDRIGLSLEILPSGPLDYDDLRAWYMRYGFEDSTYSGYILVRNPPKETP